ncbi:glycosyl hydrolase 108 family protein [Variovorax sp. J22P240]|uniref:glycoside hydrolase family 108 protein n=1 Tax=Variovorax sp. J22P240 TaxID=3053514 RepID=UPI002576006B|nr:N-acetylmuramidase [Variovorax sp. J22P240]MDM0001827.1 glycosyl hydrolase 108 family protein [Variovorax sp. J22P240]
MSKYTDAIQQLDHSLNFVAVNSPEWIKTKASMAALDQAEMAEATRDFVLASRRLDDAVAKLQAVVAGIRPDPASHFLERVNNALGSLLPVARGLDALLGGEPATALPGMQATNQATFPTAAEPIVPPLREIARGGEQAALDVAQMIDAILRREGGFVNHVNDRGGATNFGVTQRTLAAWRGAAVSVDDVRSLSIEEAREIYAATYFRRPKIDLLPAQIQPLMFDMCINHGPGTAVKLLQQLLTDNGHPCSIDGGIDAETIDCAQKMVTEFDSRMVNLLVDRRVALFEQIVARDASQGVFLRGWLNRANEFRLA